MIPLIRRSFQKYVSKIKYAKIKPAISETVENMQL